MTSGVDKAFECRVVSLAAVAADDKFSKRPLSPPTVPAAGKMSSWGISLLGISWFVVLGSLAPLYLGGSGRVWLREAAATAAMLLGDLPRILNIGGGRFFPLARVFVLTSPACVEGDDLERRAASTPLDVCDDVSSLAGDFVKADNAPWRAGDTLVMPSLPIDRTT